MTSTEPTAAGVEDSAVEETAVAAADADTVQSEDGGEATEDAVLADNLAESADLAEDAELPEGGDLAQGGDLAEGGDLAQGDLAQGDPAEGDDDATRSRDGDDENPLEVEAEVAADYLEELLDITDLDGDIDTYVDGDRAHVSIVSESNTLVGRDGEVLEALQELTRLAVLAETGQRSRLMLDVAGYRARRRTELVALAGEAVQEVKDSGEPVHLAAMNPFERKIVHDAVAAGGLTSESEGEEPRRHVVVLPARD